MVICLERGADLHMAQLLPLPPTVSCFNKIQIGFTFLVPAHLGSPGKGPLNGCVPSCNTRDIRFSSPFPKVRFLTGFFNGISDLIAVKRVCVRKSLS